MYDDQIATDAAGIYRRAGNRRPVPRARPRRGRGRVLAQVEKEIDEELARFLKDGPDAGRAAAGQERSTRRNSLRGIERIGGFGGKSDRLAISQVFRGSPDAYKISLKRVREATAEDLKSAANRWLSDGVYILEVDPFPEYKTASTGADRTPSLRRRVRLRN